MTQPETNGSPWNRFVGTADEDVRQLIGQGLKLSPEDTRPDTFTCGAAFRSIDFPSATLPWTWVRRLGKLFRDPDEVERCRQRFLTPRSWPRYAARKRKISNSRQSKRFPFGVLHDDCDD